MAEQISSLDKPITLADWHEIYQRLLPYLGGNKAVDGNPIGAVIMFPVSTPPAGYLVCDGSKLSVTAFPLLFNVLKTAPASQRATWGDADWVTEFNVPDYRGEFPRFYGTNSHANQGNGGAVGEHQDGTEHHDSILNYDTDQDKFWLVSGYDINKPDYTGGNRKQFYSTNRDFTATPSRDAYIEMKGTEASGFTNKFTSRPTNTSFLPCIKYTYVTQEVEYSEQERVVGTWIDGSDLYQKTINFGTLPNKTVKSVAHNISNFGELASIQAVAYSSEGFWRSLNMTQDNMNDLIITTQVTSSAVLVLCRNYDVTSYTKCYITLKYTKTQ